MDRETRDARKVERTQRKADLIAEARELSLDAIEGAFDEDLTVRAATGLIKQVVDILVILPDPIDELSDKAFSLLIDEAAKKIGRVIKKTFKRNAPRLERRIAKAKKAGRVKAAARLQAHLDAIPEKQRTS